MLNFVFNNKLWKSNSKAEEALKRQHRPIELCVQTGKFISNKIKKSVEKGTCLGINF